MSADKIFEIVPAYGQMLLQGGVLWATIFFYRQLVNNDNQREERVRIEAIKKWTKDTIRSAGNSGGLLQTAGSRLRRRFPSSIDTILEAYEEIQNEEPDVRLPSVSKFLEYMNGIERGQWPSEYNWPAKRK